MYKSVTGKRTLLLAGYSYSLLEDSHTVAWEGEALCFTATKNIGSRQQEMFRQRRHKNTGFSLSGWLCGYVRF